MAAQDVFTFKSEAAVDCKKTRLIIWFCEEPTGDVSLSRRFFPAVMEMVVLASQAYDNDQKRET